MPPMPRGIHETRIVSVWLNLVGLALILPVLVAVLVFDAPFWLAYLPMALTMSAYGLGTVNLARLRRHRRRLDEAWEGWAAVYPALRYRSSQAADRSKA